MQQPPYVYYLETGSPGKLYPDNIAVFTWPNVCKKYIRDTYTADGELHLPPPGHLRLTRHKVNPKPGHKIVLSLIDVEHFLEQ